jgi:ankyrin repeat protein
VGEIILEYAIYWSPLAFIRTLLDLGANPNYEGHAGFPALMAALSSQRADKAELLKLLISSGAGLQARGNNDHTPLHYAASQDVAQAIEILLQHGADPGAHTTIDDCETPLELAVRFGKSAAARPAPLGRVGRVYNPRLGSLLL